MKSTAALLLQGLKRNLGAGMRLAVFLPVSRYDFRVSPGDFVLLWAFNLLAWLAGGMLRGGFPGYVDYGALPMALAEIPLVLLASLIIASLYRKRELLLALALLLISPGALFELVSSAIVIGLRFAAADTPPAVQLTAYVAYLSWVLAVALRALWVAAGWHRRQFIQGSVLLIVLFVFLLNYMPRTEFWAVYRETSADTTQSPILQEELFHAQGGLLDANLAALQPQRAGMADLYFVGFAPYGTQDVFGKELHTVSRLMRERFDAAGRSLLLSNDPATLGDLPIASATNLRAALARVGRIMDADEDVLFLYITTHGSEDGELSVELEPLELSQIRPAALARMLHDGGIKWKVLVISACYSGGFIELLKDENTLIITATDARNQSFGCDNGEDFTWFGKAYFDEALRRTRSFAEAFELARAAVAQREREQKLTASNPQMYAGAAIKHKLAGLEARLRAE
ncbi:MAG: peptidase [Betaproteobacteria bacterium]|nr:peptidase [Betaproteobacteria bacterium]